MDQRKSSQRITQDISDSDLYPNTGVGKPATSDLKNRQLETPVRQEKDGQFSLPDPIPVSQNRQVMIVTAEVHQEPKRRPQVTVPMGSIIRADHKKESTAKENTTLRRRKLIKWCDESEGNLPLCAYQNLLLSLKPYLLRMLELIKGVM